MDAGACARRVGRRPLRERPERRSGGEGRSWARRATDSACEDDLVYVLGPLPELAYPIYLFVHKDLRRPARISAFFEFCQHELKPILLTGAMRGTFQ